MNGKREETLQEMKTRWAKACKPLVGRRIVQVRYMTPAEVEALGYYSAPMVLQLDDGTLMWPQQDDEGNNAGAMGVQPGGQTKGVPEVVPVI